MRNTRSRKFIVAVVISVFCMMSAAPAVQATPGFGSPSSAVTSIFSFFTAFFSGFGPSQGARIDASQGARIDAKQGARIDAKQGARIDDK